MQNSLLEELAKVSIDNDVTLTEDIIFPDWQDLTQCMRLQAVTPVAYRRHLTNQVNNISMTTRLMHMLPGASMLHAFCGIALPSCMPSKASDCRDSQT